MKKSRLEKVEDFIFNYGWIVVAILGALVIAIASIALAIYHNTPKPMKTPTEGQPVIEEPIEEETNEEFETRYEDEIEESKIFDIKLSDFENIHTEVSAATRNAGYNFSSSEMYGQGRVWLFNVIPPASHIVIAEAEKLYKDIDNIVDSYGYEDITVTLFVLNPKNTEVVMYVIQ